MLARHWTEWKQIAVGFDKAAADHGVQKQSGDPDAIGEHMQAVHGKVLQAAASGDLDLAGVAKRTLAARGHDTSGKWVGFDAAKKHHGLA